MKRLAIAATILVISACGGGGGGGGNPAGPTCQDGGITATAIVRPGTSRCTKPNDVSVRISNQSCSALTIEAATIEAIDPGSSCGDLSPLEVQGLDVTVASKTAETVDLFALSWCCTCTSNFSCDWQAELTLNTDQGDLVSELSKPFTKNFGPFCDACAQTQSRSLQVEGGLECAVGLEGLPFR